MPGGDVREGLTQTLETPPGATDAGTPGGPGPDVSAAASTPAPPTPEQVLALLAENKALRAHLDQLAGTKHTLAKLEQAFSKGEEGEALSKEELLAIDALKRLLPRAFPELAGLKHLPALMTTLGESAKAGAETIHQNALDTQLRLQKDAGFPVDKPEFTRLIGGAVTAWINENNDRRARYWRGDRMIVEEGFAHVHKHLLGPHRSEDKKAIVSKVESRPRTALSTAAGGGAEGERSSVVSMQSKKDMKTALKAALG